MPTTLVDPSGMDPSDFCGDDPFCGDFPILFPLPPLFPTPPAPAPPLPTPVPNPTPPSGIPNTTGVYAQGQNGSFGVYGSNGFLHPVAVGAGGELIWDVGDIMLGGICVGSGVCEAVAVVGAVVVVGTVAYIYYSKKISKVSGKETASDAPSWARYYPKGPNEACAAFAARILVEQYGVGSKKALDRGPGSEFSKIKKACERGGL